ncbi:MAG: fibrobacter succinogenes major paralogous domain-containing protein, partial [Calditrichales bacterium]|nr:fibrobacter succinogenes major paralogous domain-containing protein [Calditrichales bacterium]
AENLKVTRYRNGDAIPNETDNTAWTNLSTGAYCAYNNDNGNAETYGFLYNWYAVADNRNISPAGWHVPTDEEWKELEMYLGMSQSDADATDWRGSPVGSKLKATSGWYSSGNGTNESGFTALPGGNRSHYGSFYYIGNYGYWWSATEYGSSAWQRGLIYYDSGVGRYSYGKPYGFSVRLVRD